MKGIFTLFAALSLILTSCQGKYFNPDLDPKRLAPLQLKAEEMAAKLSDNWPASSMGFDMTFASVVTGVESWSVKFNTKYTTNQFEERLALFGEATRKQESNLGTNDPVIYAFSSITRTGITLTEYMHYGLVYGTDTSIYIDYYPIASWTSGTYFYAGKALSDNVVTIKISRAVVSTTVDIVQPVPSITAAISSTMQP
jgi:hypothetical protein